MPEPTEQPGMRTKRCPAVTFPAPGVKEQCTILVPEDRATHGGLHRWPNEDWGQLPQTLAVKSQRTVPEVVLTLGTFGLLLAFIAFMVAWFTR